MPHDPTTLTPLSTAQIIDGVYPSGAGITPYCGVQFVAWSGAVQCAGRGDSVQPNGDCTNGTCTCTATVGTQDSEITATFALCDADAPGPAGMLGAAGLHHAASLVSAGAARIAGTIRRGGSPAASANAAR